MRDRRQIVSLWQQGRAAALVTLVRVSGSSYRRVGARLLIAQDGDHAGSISGGCLEAEMIRKAHWMVRDGATVQQYSTLFDDTADMPYGLGCGGTVDLLLEPAGTPAFEALVEAMEASLRGERVRVVTQLPDDGSPMRRCILNDHGENIFHSREGFVDRAKSCFDEWLEPPQRLFVFGAGDDAQPVVQMAAMLGWSVIVVDSRAHWARAERFPGAERVATSLDDVRIGAQDAVVTMTHSYEQDRAWLTEVLPAGPRYLGLLGARHRSALLIAEAASALEWSVEQACERVFAPVGLDLGGDGAEAIALATVAEIQACVEGKLGHSRRLNTALVEEQLQQGSSARYLQPQCAL